MRTACEDRVNSYDEGSPTLHGNGLERTQRQDDSDGRRGKQPLNTYTTCRPSDCDTFNGDIRQHHPGGTRPRQAVERRDV